MNSDSIAAAAEGIAARLRAAEQQCHANYVNPHRESATLPIIRELAEVVAALAQRIPISFDQFLSDHYGGEDYVDLDDYRKRYVEYLKEQEK